MKNCSRTAQVFHTCSKGHEKPLIPRIILNLNEVIKNAKNPYKTTDKTINQYTKSKQDLENNWKTPMKSPEHLLKENSYSKIYSHQKDGSVDSFALKIMSENFETINNTYNTSAGTNYTKCIRTKPFKLSKSNHRNKRSPQSIKRYKPIAHKPFKASPIPEYYQLLL